MAVSDLDPDLLRAFLAVAEHRSFTRAADQLNRTQSAVSVQVRRLEQRLGAKLFQRARTGIVPTAAGEELRVYAQRILALHAEAVTALHARKPETVIRLGVMDDYGTIVVPPLLASFAKSHPTVRVEVETGLTATMPARLGEAYDLVIAMHPVGRGDGELLRREQAVWAAAASCRAMAEDALPVALYPPGCLFRQWAAEALDHAGRPWRLAYVSRTLAAVESIAAQGLAITVVKASTLPPRLRPLGPRDGLPPLPAADIRLHRARDLSRPAALLGDHLRRGISEPATLC
ncbi:LysR family transcriptional regulator [Bradyrhizobium guangzhouense]|uniref:LysR family transcriptional regulator n=1 Tax=Bradyrhizobium guangzhouense TaxID=1325095 RepID=A0AAE6C9G0_9BRAD|nr:LysR family transcriptional regulator [Bradyrhizobium guangzhouense]QAU47589.1 LysR family transcriptional regulator [Bradyrhizobium guangzhouense]RXH09785.1 LysR family transcriptional regulator [Bradyrhizobium guangzhouense]RXH18736.1 LysR family transcriptional regulator [Bradyrhizobium guangzhouense]